MTGSFRAELCRGLLVSALIAVAIVFISFSQVRVAKAETCVASHYGHGDGFAGRRTASGERMDPHAMIAAHRTRPFGSWVTVSTNAGRSVRVRIVDRGPFVKGRCIDLSYGASRVLGMGGTARVSVE